MKILVTTMMNQFTCEYLQSKYPTHQFVYQNQLTEFDENLVDSDIIITYGSDLSSRHLKVAQQLKWISVFSAGIEELPLEIIFEREIIITNARGIHAIPIAEFAFSLMLSYAKCLPQISENQKRGVWERKLPFQELYGKTLVLLGTGAISRQIAKLAKAFSMSVIGINQSQMKYEDYDSIYAVTDLLKVLPVADYLISILPSTVHTNNLLQKEHFQAMKKEAVFMNLGRGNLFQDDTLIEALQEDEIAQAILDVYHQEPVPTNHPYWKSPNLVMTPHISSISKNYLPRALAIFERNFEKWLAGERETLENKINPLRGY